LERHLIRFGTEGRPTVPRREHMDWAEQAADKILTTAKESTP
jgi:hypothetical protein